MHPFKNNGIIAIDCNEVQTPVPIHEKDLPAATDSL